MKKKQELNSLQIVEKMRNKFFADCKDVENKLEKRSLKQKNIKEYCIHQNPNEKIIH